MVTGRSQLIPPATAHRSILCDLFCFVCRYLLISGALFCLYCTLKFIYMFARSQSKSATRYAYGTKE